MQDRGLKIGLLAWLMCFGVSQGEVLDISRVGMGARTLGLGRAQVSLGDLSSAYVNPANAAQLDHLSVSSMYTNLNEDVAYNMFGIGFPLADGSPGSLAFSYLGAGVSGVQITSRDADSRTISTSSTNYSSQLAVLSYGRKMTSNLSLGAALKLYLRSLDAASGGSANGFDLDLGMLYAPRENLLLGLAVQNALPVDLANLKWGTGAKEDIPLNIRAGINFTPREGLGLVGDYDLLGGFHGGVEWKIHKHLCLRGGAEMLSTGKSSSATNFTAGVGLNYKGFNFDYAYYYDSVVNSISSHFFSLGFEMAPKEGPPVAKPPMAPPIMVEPVKIITPEVSAPIIPKIIKPLPPAIKKKATPPKKPPVKPKKKIAALKKFVKYR
jgi:hypothetical protein